MDTLKVGGLYIFKTTNGERIRGLLIGYRPHIESMGSYIYDIDKKCYHTFSLNEIDSVRRINPNVLKNNKLREHLSKIESRFDNIASKEAKLCETKNKAFFDYQKAKARYEKAKKEYEDKIEIGYANLEKTAGDFSLFLLDKGFDFDNQSLGKSLNIEGFKNALWYYLDPNIKQKLLSPCRYTLVFNKNTFIEDGGCWYYFKIEREVIVPSSIELVRNSLDWQKHYQKESSKELEDLKYLAAHPFIPYEELDRMYGYSNELYYCEKNCRNKAKAGKNIYSSTLLSREFKPFPLTAENAKKIAEGIHIVY